jgi:hypothetical protein
VERLEDRTLLAAPHPFDLATLNGTNGFRLDGIDAYDVSGYSVSTAGDVNGDGYDDILVGTPSADPGGDIKAGETYMVFGSGSGFATSLDLSTLDGSNGFRLDGVAGNGDDGTTPDIFTVDVTSINELPTLFHLPLERLIASGDIVNLTVELHGTCMKTSSYIPPPLRERSHYENLVTWSASYCNAWL